MTINCWTRKCIVCGAAVQDQKAGPLSAQIKWQDCSPCGRSLPHTLRRPGADDFGGAGPWTWADYRESRTHDRHG
jgi:hypothetical protein